MNCIKCNASIPEGKLFCPNCGHLNERITSKPSIEVDSKQIDSKRNNLALIGGILIIISFSLPFYNTQGLTNASGEKYSMNTLGISSIINSIQFIFRMNERGILTIGRFSRRDF